MDRDTSFNEAMYIGTYTRKEGHVDGKAEGVYFIDGNGAVVVATSDIINPSYVHLASEGGLLFAASEINAQGGGLLVVYKVESDNTLTRLAEHSTSGAYPCHVTSNKNGDIVFVANYAGGIDMFSVSSDSLSLVQSVSFEGGSDHPRQDASHPHMALYQEATSTLYVSDLGTNRIYRFQVSDNGIAEARQSYFELVPHAGPRHLALHPSNSHLYVINELNSTVDVLSIDPGNGGLIRRQSVPTVPDSDKGSNSPAAIRVHPSGNYLWCSNRGHNSLTGYKIAKDGLLEQMSSTPCKGDAPRDFNITSDGKWLLAANQNSDNIVRFRIGEGDGSLSYDGQVSVKTPVCIAFSN